MAIRFVNGIKCYPLFYNNDKKNHNSNEYHSLLKSSFSSFDYQTDISTLYYYCYYLGREHFLVRLGDFHIHKYYIITVEIGIKDLNLKRKKKLKSYI